MSIFDHKISQITLFGTEQIVIDQSIYNRKPNMFEFCPKYQKQYKIHYSDKHGVLLTLIISESLENGIYAFNEPTSCDFVRIEIIGDPIPSKYIYPRGDEISAIEDAISQYVENKLKFYQKLQDKIKADI